MASEGLDLHLIKINDASTATSTLHIALVNMRKVMALRHYLSPADQLAGALGKKWKSDPDPH